MTRQHNKKEIIDDPVNTTKLDLSEAVNANTFKNLDYDFDITQTDIFLSVKPKKNNEALINMLYVLLTLFFLSSATLFTVLSLFNNYVYITLYLIALVMALQVAKRKNFTASILLLAGTVTIPLLLLYLKNR